MNCATNLYRINIYQRDGSKAKGYEAELFNGKPEKCLVCGKTLEPGWVYWGFWNHGLFCSQRCLRENALRYPTEYRIENA